LGITMTAGKGSQSVIAGKDSRSIVGVSVMPEIPCVWCCRSTRVQ